MDNNMQDTRSRLQNVSDIRPFPFITVGKILKVLKKEGCPISRITYYKLEAEGLFASTRTAGDWRRYTLNEAELIIQLIKQNYGVA